MTIFDIIIAAVIVVSAVMSLGRGLVREAFSVASFIVGAIVGYLSVSFLEPVVRPWLAPNEKDPALVSIAVTFGVGFLTAYVAAALIGGRMSKLFHANPEIGVLDRLAGAAFGVARGIAGAVVFVLLMQQVLPEGSAPSEIAKARSYPYLDAAASWVRSVVPGFVKSAADVLKDQPPANGT